jgi:hypothetical protein
MGMARDQQIQTVLPQISCHGCAAELVLCWLFPLGAHGKLGERFDQQERLVHGATRGDGLLAKFFTVSGPEDSSTAVVALSIHNPASHPGIDHHLAQHTDKFIIILYLNDLAKPKGSMLGTIFSHFFQHLADLACLGAASSASPCKTSSCDRKGSASPHRTRWDPHDPKQLALPLITARTWLAFTAYSDCKSLLDILQNQTPNKNIQKRCHESWWNGHIFGPRSLTRIRNRNI